MFDVNRSELLSSLIAPGPKQAFQRMVAVPALPFCLTVVGNASHGSAEVVEWIREPGQRDVVAKPTGLAWPNRVFSLGHLAIPMPIDDPAGEITSADLTRSCVPAQCIPTGLGPAGLPR